MVLPDAPEPLPGAEWLWDAWQYLQTGRAMLGGMGVMSLQIAQRHIDEYADRIGCDSDSRYVLHKVITALDRVLLKHEAEEAKKRAK